MDAARALDWGYVTAIHAPERLLAEVTAYAARLADGPILAIRAAKRLVYRGLEAGEDASLDLAAATMPIMLSTEDAKEGPAAFRERRSPRFQGR